jgi:hypothetical protein
MSKFYIIQWKSKLNGRAGKGTKMFEWEEAAELAEELNREYPDIQHEVVEATLVEEPVASEEEPAPGPEMPQTNHSPDHALSFE